MDGVFPLLLNLLYTLPALLASVAALAWLLQRAPAQAPGRRQALAGTGLVLGACLVQMALGLAQTWAVHQASQGGGLAALTMIRTLSVLGLPLALASATGIALLGWGAAQAMSGYRASP